VHSRTAPISFSVFYYALLIRRLPGLLGHWQHPEQLLFVNIANSADELNEVLSANGQDFTI